MKDRLLIIGAPKSGKFTLVKTLFNSLPSIPQSQPHAGLVHRVKLETKYYKTGIDLWIDEMEDLGSWCEEFKSDEAKEARDVISGIVFMFKFEDGIEKIRKDVEELVALIDIFKNDCLAGDLENQEEEYEEWDGLVLGVGMGHVGHREAFEDVFVENGIEMIKWDEDGKNEYGEKRGVERVREVIECYEWEIVEFEDIPVAVQPSNTTEDEGDRDAKNVNLLTGKDVDLDVLLRKLNVAKDHIGHLKGDKERHEYAMSVIDSLDL